MAVIRQVDGTWKVTAKGGKWRKCYSSTKCQHQTEHEDGHIVCSSWAKCPQREVKHLVGG